MSLIKVDKVFCYYWEMFRGCKSVETSESLRPLRCRRDPLGPTWHSSHLPAPLELTFETSPCYLTVFSDRRCSRSLFKVIVKVTTDPKITARRYDSDTGSVSFIVFVFLIRYSIKAAQQDSAFKITHIEAKSINRWLRYDPKWNMCGN